jgi:transposase-like protein
MDPKELNLVGLSKLFADEDAARDFLEMRLWPDGPVCPHCESTEAYTLTARPDSKKPVRKGVYKCKKCRQQFTVRIGTIFEDSKIPLCKWLMALHLLTSSKKGISSLQIARELGITHKSAWFLTHRIREAMRTVSPPKPTKGIVEMDETYVGGKPTKFGAKRGRGTSKTPVVALIQRGGNVRAVVVDRVTAKNLRAHAVKHMHPDSCLMTDEFKAYGPVGREFSGHGIVTHSWGEYVKGKAHVNTCESFFALLKRGHYGTFHQLSKTHLHRYVDEFEFRWNHRKVSDGARMLAAISGVEGKRLMYRQPRQSA